MFFVKFDFGWLCWFGVSGDDDVVVGDGGFFFVGLVFYEDGVWVDELVMVYD